MYKLRIMLLVLVASLSLAGLGLMATPVLAASITTAGSGDWNSAITNSPWPNGTVPLAGDDVFIASGHMITISQPITLQQLQLLLLMPIAAAPKTV